MKKISFLIALFIALIPLRVYAQNIMPPEQAETTTENPTDTATDTTDAVDTAQQDFTNPFTIEVTVGTQSPWTKKIPITVKVRPNINTTRTQITWDVPSGLTLNDSKVNEYYALAKGQVLTRTVKVKPELAGTYTVAATATDWGYGENVTNSKSITLTFSESLIATPITADYSAAVLARWIVIGVLALVTLVALVLGGKKGLKLLKEWLKPPEL